MQYILSEDEYRRLNNAPAVEREKQQKIIDDLCQKVCDHMPIEGWHANCWDEELVKGTKKPWGCVKTRAGEGFEWYCDNCPTKQHCSYPKHYSK